MVIIIKFIGSFRSILGKDTLVINSEGKLSLRKAINEITKELPKLKKVLIDPKLEDSRSNTLILVNGKEISVLNDLDTVLKDDDEVVFIPVVHGG